MGNRGWAPLIISHYPDNFYGHRPSRIGDILFLIGHVTSCDHVVNGLYGIIGRSLPTLVTTTQALCKFLLKIHNLPVITCVDQWPAFLKNKLKKAFWMQTSARISTLETG